MVTPSYMLAIAEEMERQGIDPEACSLEIGIFGAEPWTPTMREAIEAQARDGRDRHLRAVGGDRSRRRAGMHRDQGRPHRVGGSLLPGGHRSRRRATCCPKARSGELVFTSLTKEALPIVRYRTRDLTRLLPPTARSMRRIEKITGRSDDMMIIRGVNVFPTQIEELMLREPALAPHYQIEIARPGQPRRDDGAGRARAGRGQRATASTPASALAASHQEPHRRLGEGVGAGARTASSARSGRRGASSTSAPRPDPRDALVAVGL